MMLCASRTPIPLSCRQSSLYVVSLFSYLLFTHEDQTAITFNEALETVEQIVFELGTLKRRVWFALHSKQRWRQQQVNPELQNVVNLALWIYHLMSHLGLGLKKASED